jgi:CheY-like chemotaxis protein
MNRPVASVPLSSSITQIARTLRRLQPELLLVDALEIRTAGFLFIDALRQDEILAACPVLIVASGSFPDEDRFTKSAQGRGLHVMLEAVSFEDLCEKSARSSIGMLAAWRRSPVSQTGAIIAPIGRLCRPPRRPDEQSHPDP